jgi:hypothetical protein
MAWEEYAARTRAEYDALLASDPQESEMQGFFERHPTMLPGAFPGWTGHGAFLHLIVAQPPLRSIGTKIPDFLWIARDTAGVRPVLIEIEKPGKKWLSGRRKAQSADLSEALAQLREWREWMNVPGNQQTFMDAYAIPPEWRRMRRFEPIYMLIYGRRAEDPDGIARIREDARDRDVLLTYDHLEGPYTRHKNYISATNNGSGQYTALEMPGCATLGPDNHIAAHWQLIDGHREMVERNPWITDERKAFLLKRIEEWDQWARDAPEAERKAGEARERAREARRAELSRRIKGS